MRGTHPRGLPTAARRHDESGQVLPIFVLLSVVLLGGAALLTDVAWWWANQQRMQRAADAGALAGAIHLPGNESLAFSTALAETAKNGYTSGANGITITPRRDPGDSRKLIVDVGGDIGTHFARVFCWDGGPCLDGVSLNVTGAASYVLPVPMGSPQNYYGVGYLVDATEVTTTAREDDDTGWNATGGPVGTGQWSNAGNASSNDNAYAFETTDGHAQQWATYGLLSEIPNDPTTVIDGIRIRLTDVFIRPSSASNCRVDVQLSWDGGTSWSSIRSTSPLSTSSFSDRTVGSSSSTSGWGGHTWVRSDFADPTFQVRLTWHDGTAGCPSSREVRLDRLQARVYYHYDATTTSTVIGPADVLDPTTGQPLAPQNFWGAMQSQGAPNVQGDAYMAYYDTRTSWTNPDYDPDAYYHYAVEFPAGASSGEVWLFDPGFCDVGSSRGTGERWNTSSAYGFSPRQPITAIYDLYDTKNTPYSRTDDVMVSTSGSLFRESFRSDHVFGETFANDCSGDSWHNGWWRLAEGLQGGKTYRIHTQSTDPSNPTGQVNSTANNAFAIYAAASGGTPRVHGLGAMEAYVRLPGGQSSEFYLAQIDAEHAGKTLAIKLWDPGDTGNLAANLQILMPTATDYVVTPFSYTAEPNSHHSNTSDCASNTGTSVTSVTTNTGGTSLYNGCWLTIEIPLAGDYSAPSPSSDTVTNEGGWWKIRYNMSGSTSDNSTDMTTWEVEVRGSPVHLVLE